MCVFSQLRLQGATSLQIMLSYLYFSPTLSFTARSVFPGNLLFYRQSWFCVSSACDYPIFGQCTEQQVGLHLIETSLAFQKAAENGWQEKGEECLFTQYFDVVCSSVSQFKWGRSSSIFSCLSSSVIPCLDTVLWGWVQNLCSLWH